MAYLFSVPYSAQGRTRARESNQPGGAKGPLVHRPRAAFHMAATLFYYLMFLLGVVAAQSAFPFFFFFPPKSQLQLLWQESVTMELRMLGLTVAILAGISVAQTTSETTTTSSSSTSTSLSAYPGCYQFCSTHAFSGYIPDKTNKPTSVCHAGLRPCEHGRVVRQRTGAR